MRRLPFIIAVILGLTVLASDPIIPEESDLDFLVTNYNGLPRKTAFRYFDCFEFSKENTRFYSIDTLDMLMASLKQKYCEDPHPKEKKILSLYDYQEAVRVFEPNQLDFIRMIETLTGTKIHPKKYQYVPDGVLYAHISEASIDSLYRKYQTYKKGLSVEIITEYLLIWRYLDLYHPYDHPWHDDENEDDSLCPTHDSLMCELENLRMRVYGIDTPKVCCRGYSLLEDSTISDLVKIKRLDAKIGCLKLYNNGADPRVTKELLEHVLDSLKRKTKR